MLPQDADRIVVRGIRVGDAAADINFERVSDGKTTVRVIALTGKLDVVLESE